MSLKGIFHVILVYTSHKNVQWLQYCVNIANGVVGHPTMAFHVGARCSHQNATNNCPPPPNAEELSTLATPTSKYS